MKKLLFLLTLFASLGVAAQTPTKVDPNRLLKPGANSTTLYTNGSGVVGWGDASQVYTAGTGIGISSNTFAVTGLNQAQEEGSDLTARLKINFIGSGITAADNAGSSRTDVTLDAELNGLSALTGTGFPAMTGAGAFSNRTLQAGTDASGLLAVWTNPAGTAGDPSLALSTNAFAYKRAVRVVSTSNLTLSGTQTVDGVALSAGDRILVAGQTTAANNGPYIVSAGAWTRAGDMDAAAEFEGAVVNVREGTAQSNSEWTLTTAGAITVGSTALAFKRLSRANQATAGTYGSGTQVPVFVLNDDGTIASVTNTNISASLPTLDYQIYREVMASSGTTVTVTGFTPTVATTDVYVDGVLMENGSGNDYTLSGSVYTFTSSLNAGQKVIVKKVRAQ